MTRVDRIATNTAWNLMGLALPMVVALFTVPIFIRRIGIERFGVLSIALVVMGYGGIFELGLGRSLTKSIADRLGRSGTTDPRSLVWTGLLLTTLFGVIAGILVTATSHLWSDSIFRVPPMLRPEMRGGLVVLAWSLPLVTCTAALRGTLEAYQRFDIVNAIRLPATIYTFVAPLAVSYFTLDLPWMLGGILIGRVFVLLVYAAMGLHVVPGLASGPLFSAADTKELLWFGGWTTVSSALAPLVDSADQLSIGAILSSGAVSYYAAPNSAVGRLGVLSTALVSVLFPILAGAYKSGDMAAFRKIMRLAAAALIVTILPLTLLLAGFAPVLLGVWLGPEFRLHSSTPLRLLLAAQLLGAIVTLLVTSVHAAGRPDLTAKLSVIELPFYAGLMWLLVGKWGITGAALAVLIRYTVYVGVLLAFLAKLFPARFHLPIRSLLLSGAGIAAFALSGCDARMYVKFFGLAVGIGISGMVARAHLSGFAASPFQIWRSRFPRRYPC